MDIEIVDDEGSEQAGEDATQDIFTLEADLISFDVDSSGDLIVYYDEEEKIRSEITAGLVDSVEIVAIDGDDIYINIKPDGMGGYVLYSGYRWMYQIDATDWSYVQIPIDGFMTELSTEYQKALLIEHLGSRLAMVIMDLETFEKSSYSIDSTYGQAGDAYFSPDGTKVAYATAVGDPTNEASAIYIYNIVERLQTEYMPHTAGVYEISGWLDNDSVDYTLN